MLQRILTSYNFLLYHYGTIQLRSIWLQKKSHTLWNSLNMKDISGNETLWEIPYWFKTRSIYHLRWHVQADDCKQQSQTSRSYWLADRFWVLSSWDPCEIKTSDLWWSLSFRFFWCIHTKSHFCSWWAYKKMTHNNIHNEPSSKRTWEETRSKNCIKSDVECWYCKNEWWWS